LAVPVTMLVNALPFRTRPDLCSQTALWCHW